MARGRGPSVLNSDVVQVTTRRKGLDYDSFEPMSQSRRIAHITATTAEDLDNIKSRSRRTDQALLSDISNKLLRMDFERVKPSTEVALVTGFRRPLYSRGFPPVEKETRRQRRKDELRYPWDNTRDNFYRYKPKSKKRTSPGVFIANEYPEHDPLGLYTPRTRRSSESAIYSDILPGQNTEFLLAKLRAKMRTVPHGSLDEDRNTYLDILCTPVPRHVAKYEPVKMDSYSDTSVSREPVVNMKVQDSKGIIADFEAELESRAQRSREARRWELGAAARALNMMDLSQGGDYTETELGVRDTEPFFTPVVVPARKHVYRAASVPRSVGVSVSASARPPTGYSRRPYLVTRSVVVPRTPSPVRQRLLIDVEDSYVRPERITHLPESIGSLRHKTVEARNKLDQARSLYDRYLPVPSGALGDVQAEVDYKYGELAARIPSLERHSGKTSYFGLTGPVAPYKPAPAPPTRGGQPSYMTCGLRHPPPRPKVSEVRRNARNVLCRTKGDPNYYTY